MKNQTIVEVTWRDAWSSARSYCPDGDHTGVLSKTIGYLREYTDTSVVLVMCIGEDNEDTGRPTFCIPSEYIITVEELV